MMNFGFLIADFGELFSAIRNLHSAIERGFYVHTTQSSHY